MTTKKRLRRLRAHLTWSDALLLAAGVLGLILYLWLLPAQHPDSAADYSLGEDEAAQIARAFAEENGLSIPEDTRQQVTLRRNEALVDSLQRALTRPAATRLLKSKARERLPVYYWNVGWEEAAGEDEEEYNVDVYLTASGVVYGYALEDYDFESGGVLQNAARAAFDRKALTYALAETPSRQEGEGRLAAVPDSLLPRLARRLSFRFPPVDTAAATYVSPPPPPPSGASVIDAIDPLSRDEAVLLARYHLNRTALKDYGLRADSVWTDQDAGSPRTATVRFWGAPFHGQRPRVDVTVAATGALLGLDTEFNPEDGTPPAAAQTPSDQANQPAASDDEGSGDSVTISIEASSVANGITGVLYVLLGLAAHVIFFQRMNARLVDTSMALRDALWGGLFAAAFVAVVSFGSIMDESGGEFWIEAGGIAVVVLFSGAGGALLIFMVSGAMDSVARARWSEKLATLDLVRRGAVRNVPVGVALVRGVTAAFALLGGTALLLALLPEAAIHFSDQDGGSLSHEMFLSFFASAVSMQGWVGLFVALTVFLGVGTLLCRWQPSAWLVVPGLTLTLFLTQTTLVSLRPMALYAVEIGFVSLVLAGVFWRYDFIAAFAAYFVSGTIWMVTNGWMIASSPEALDAALAFSMTGLLLVVGVVGLVSGRTSTEVPTYVPGYITELAEQERLKRDMEIAQEVQQSFLPRTMPQVEGLDLAAMCLPAQDVGGDYYDFVKIAPGRLAVVIGDVSGKGIQAGFYMTLAKGFLQSLASEARAPADVLRRLNTLFCANAPRGIFISMIYGVFDVAAGTFTFARAGHNPLIYKRSPNETAGFVQPKGIAIGLSPEHFDACIEEETLPLRAGEALVFYTDGFSEAMNRRGEQFGEDRMARRLDAVSRRPAQEILRAISDEVSFYVEGAGRHDDMTMVVVKRRRGQSAEAAQVAVRQAEAPS